MRGYPFSFPTSGYFKPIGGNFNTIIPGLMAVQNVPFLRFFLEIGGRSTAIQLETPEKGLVVFGPIPWSPETEKFIMSFSDDGKLPNVKYLIAPDVEHHMGIKSWLEHFPQAKVIGPDGLIAKKKKEGVTIDYAFTNAHGRKLLSSEALANDTSLNFPAEIINEFDFAYFPDHVNHELVVLHKPTKTFLTADLFFNLPATQQYQGHINSPTSGLSYLTNYLGIDSWLQRKLLGSALPEKEYTPLFNQLYSWGFERVIMCHGNILEGPDVKEKFAKLYSKYIKKNSSSQL